MSNKITLITPPDIYENANFSLLFIGLKEPDQETTSKWLGEKESFPLSNFYFYQGENNMTWLLYSLNRSDFTFVDLDTEEPIINVMSSYILSRPNVYYTTKNENLKALMSYINNKFVDSVEKFLEKVYND